MKLIHVLKNQRILSAFIVWAIILIPFSGVFAENDKKPEPTPLTTKNPNISKEELEYLVEPLTKDDLSVEANGWLQVLKKHVGGVSVVQIQTLTAEGDEKTKLLETVNKLKEEQTALTDRFKVVIEALKSKGGEIKDYESYITAIAGVKVDAMTIVSTTLRKPDNQKVVVPNNMIWGDIITNITGTSKRRVDLVFGIGYSDDIAKAQKILEDILANNESILKDPKPVVKVHELADSSVNFVVRPWVQTENYWDIYWDITRTVKERFDAEGVSIPFPQRDVHVHQLAST
jgi:hypothetical protein